MSPLIPEKQSKCACIYNCPLLLLYTTFGFESEKHDNSSVGAASCRDIRLSNHLIAAGSRSYMKPELSSFISPDTEITPDHSSKQDAILKL
jgi:hypothetical protein